MTRLKDGRGPTRVPDDFDFAKELAEAMVLDACDVVMPEILRMAAAAGALVEDQS